MYCSAQNVLSASQYTQKDSSYIPKYAESVPNTLIHAKSLPNSLKCAKTRQSGLTCENLPHCVNCILKHD